MGNGSQSAADETDRAGTRRVSRRGVLGLVSMALLAGCGGGGGDTEPTRTTATPTTRAPTTTTETTTRTTTDEPTTEAETTTEETEPTTEQPEPLGFTEIYMTVVDRDPAEYIAYWDGPADYTDAIPPTKQEQYRDVDLLDNFDEYIVDIKDDFLDYIPTVVNDSQELTAHFQQALHNDLDLPPDEVRALGRDTAGGGTYTAIFHRNDTGFI